MKSEATDNTFVPLRLQPGEDLRAALEALARQRGQSAFVVAGVGSLGAAQLRWADRPEACAVAGPLEILSLQGSLTPDGAHLHMAVADADGRVRGGHVAPGCTVRTTAELLLAWLPGYTLRRQHDPATGYPELAVWCPPGESVQR